MREDGTNLRAASVSRKYLEAARNINIADCSSCTIYSIKDPAEHLSSRANAVKHIYSDKTRDLVRQVAAEVLNHEEEGDENNTVESLSQIHNRIQARLHAKNPTVFAAPVDNKVDIKNEDATQGYTSNLEAKIDAKRRIRQYLNRLPKYEKRSKQKREKLLKKLEAETEAQREDWKKSLTQEQLRATQRVNEQMAEQIEEYGRKLNIYDRCLVQREKMEQKLREMHQKQEDERFEEFMNHLAVLNKLKQIRERHERKLLRGGKDDFFGGGGIVPGGAHPGDANNIDKQLMGDEELASLTMADKAKSSWENFLEKQKQFQRRVSLNVRALREEVAIRRCDACSFQPKINKWDHGRGPLQYSADKKREQKKRLFEEWEKREIRFADNICHMERAVQTGPELDPLPGGDLLTYSEQAPVKHISSNDAFWQRIINVADDAEFRL